MGTNTLTSSGTKEKKSPLVPPVVQLGGTSENKSQKTLTRTTKKLIYKVRLKILKFPANTTGGTSRNKAEKSTLTSIAKIN